MERLQWRRNKVLELSSQGRSQPEIATTLQVGLGTVSRDVQYLREQARDNLKTYINQRLPEEYQKCMTGLNQVLKMGWDIVHSDSIRFVQTNKEKTMSNKAEDNDKESKEPDYDEDEDQLEEKQEEETGELEEEETTNQVF